MTQPVDPVRWTSSGGDVPESLRDVLRAGLDEGPSEQQTEALVLRLAAVTAVGGLAAAAVASSGKTGSALAALGGSWLTKTAATVAMTSALVVGGARLVRKQAAEPKPRQGTTSAPERVELEPVLAPIEEDAPSLEKSKPTRAQRRARAKARARKAEAAKNSAEASADDAASLALVAERSLLRRAREKLATQPLEAFALTEQHRAQFPSGTFDQEREALAVEALLRAGDARARARAELFVQRYPHSPHAHRFRDALSLD